VVEMICPHCGQVLIETKEAATGVWNVAREALICPECHCEFWLADAALRAASRHCPVGTREMLRDPAFETRWFARATPR